MRLQVVLVLLLAGCAAEPPPPAPTPETITYAAPTTRTTAPTKTVDDKTRYDMKRAACERGGPFNPTSKPYEGDGPHPFEVFEVSTPGSPMQHSPVTWGGNVGLYDVNIIQLVACVIPVLGTQSGTVTCRFSDGAGRTWPFHEATYQVTLREARTGREITTLTAVGDDTPEESCPLFATDYPNAVVARSLTSDGIREAVRPVTSGPA
jgi:hypothetical protein